jgi:hypothetical protein
MELLLIPFADDATFNDPIGLLEPGERATVQGGKWSPEVRRPGGPGAIFCGVSEYLPNLENE